MKRIIIFLILVMSVSLGTAQTDSLKIKERLEQLMDSSATYYEATNYSKSLELNVRIIEEAKKINDTGYLQSGFRYLGYDYLILQDTIQARESFERSQEYANLAQDSLGLGLTYMDLANLYGYSDNSINKALQYHDKSIAIFEKTKDSFNLSNAYLNTVLTLQEHERYDKSLKYLKKADQLKNQLSNSLKTSLENQWAIYYLHENNYKKVDYHLSKIFKDTLLQASKFELADSYLTYSLSLYGQKRYKEAYEYSVKYQNLYEETTEEYQNEESQKIAANFQVAEYKKNIERNELKNRLQAEIVRNQINWNKFLIVVAASSILLLILLYRMYKSKKDYVKSLTEKNIEYLTAKNESEQSTKAKTAFFSTVSHELRTPLYGVIGLSTILMDDPKLKSHQQDLKSLKFSADYLLALINDVLQINKIDSNTVIENNEVFNTRDFIKNIVSSFEYMRQQNKNNIHINIDDNVPEFVKGDATRLSQILMNLVGNACKFTENGDIYILLEASGLNDQKASIHFTIQDTGIGIPEEKQQSIFDEFSQVSSRHYTYQGTGLGLPIVQKLLALSGAEIHLSSKEGKGSTFFFTLDFEISNESLIVDPIIIIDDKQLKNKRILIVDDNRINQIVTKKILQKLEVTCSIANNGQEAVECARDNEYDLILMDINMPVKDGLEATKEIRLFNKQIPIIALTAVEVKEMRYKIYNAGLTDIIVKPYDITIFKRTILRNLQHTITDQSAIAKQLHI
ncbi:hybrid sensor histidine kinase/response regulator [Dokdonia sp. Dokd-P16]|uniref:tetratricopeptide repeat-containing hybrid sensor histidine kinase/response regulator n=1 Tax=Dokdonia sp. Dokd-P16 TaxID=2173169 RepID=UPI000D546D3B|nr:ATP-binding protein [Dokdonia sp. Dokd-P16]AWH74258.1 hybrid sensor histidine kinase/response regulator [Dokdonia sp. Dokd-P16]